MTSVSSGFSVVNNMNTVRRTAQPIAVGRAALDRNSKLVQIKSPLRVAERRLSLSKKFSGLSVHRSRNVVLRATATSESSNEAQTRVASAAAWIAAWRQKQMIKEHFDAKDASIAASQETSESKEAAELADRVAEAVTWIENWRSKTATDTSEPELGVEERVAEAAAWIANWRLKQTATEPEPATELGPAERAAEAAAWIESWRTKQRVATQVMEAQAWIEAWRVKQLSEARKRTWELAQIAPSQQQQATWRQVTANRKLTNEMATLDGEQQQQALTRQLSAQRKRTWKLAKLMPEDEERAIARQLELAGKKSDDVEGEVSDSVVEEPVEDRQVAAADWIAAWRLKCRQREAQRWIAMWRAKSARRQENLMEDSVQQSALERQYSSDEEEVEGMVGCTDETAENFKPDAEYDDGSCLFKF
eukprot:CAMPEP_0197845908 /NCGR_PEP_ID=MMETSP1438-20131217/2765_1 /TAXON_ID=1461541 /ORGANISM="Pterosperma sp., Strain CCMP1384" /LENGTH=419 /DNA_ID=CAMNT_0043457381 /DNA_START=123 /DNA_END=1382 /DNA_ORIENTATION=-